MLRGAAALAGEGSSPKPRQGAATIDFETENALETHREQSACPSGAEEDVHIPGRGPQEARGWSSATTVPQPGGRRVTE